MALAGHVANYKIYSSVLINFGRGIRKGNIFTATNRHDYFGRVRLLICCGRMKNARLILDKASVFFMDKKVSVFQRNPQRCDMCFSNTKNNISLGGVIHESSSNR